MDLLLDRRTGRLPAIALLAALACGVPLPPADELPGAPTLDGGEATPGRPLIEPVQEPEEPRPLTWPPLQTTVRRYALEIAPAALEQMLATPQRDLWAEARFTVGERSFKARARLRGKYARTFPKKSFKVELLEGEFEGRTKFHLVAEWMDTTLMAEKMAMDMFLAAGVPAPRTWFAELTLNGQHQGLYTDIEHVGKRFMKRHGFRGAGDALYRCGQHDCELKDVPARHYQEPWKDELAESDGPEYADDPAEFPPLFELIGALNRTPPQAFEELLPRLIDLPEYLRYSAMNTLVVNDTEEDGRGFWARSASDGLWHYTPWDLNNGRMMLSRRASPNHVHDGDRPIYPFSAYDPVVQERIVERSFFEDFRPTWSTLNTRLYEQRSLRERYLDELERMTDELFAPTFFQARVGAVHALIRDAVERDPYTIPSYAARTLEHYGHFARNRESFLRERIAEERRALVTGKVVINEVARGWVELYNAGHEGVDLGGLWVTTDARHPARRLGPGLSIAPGGWLVLTAAELGFDPGAASQLAFFRTADAADPLEVLLFGTLPASGETVGRIPDGSDVWRLLSATRGGKNAL